MMFVNCSFMLKRRDLQFLSQRDSSSTVACFEAARDNKSPIILQTSQGGAAFFAGKGVDNKNQEASIAGAVAAAHYIRSIAPTYGVPWFCTPITVPRNCCHGSMECWGLFQEDW